MLDHAIVGKQIASLRKQKKLTQEDLAEKLGITAQAISKWENGHTLPETILLPILAKLLSCTIDAILMPFEARDAAFMNFVRAANSSHGELAMQLYQRLQDTLNFIVNYDEKYYIFDAVYYGNSATIKLPDKEDFIIRIDVETETTTGDHPLAVRISLVNCSGYMHLVDEMPEHIKRNFRVSDCNSCTCNCPYCMHYQFEGVEYKQCHFITIDLDTAENMACILALAFAEQEAIVSK